MVAPHHFHHSVCQSPGWPVWRQVVVLTAGYSTLFYRFKATGVKASRSSAKPALYLAYLPPPSAACAGPAPLIGCSSRRMPSRTPLPARRLMTPPSARTPLPGLCRCAHHRLAAACGAAKTPLLQLHPPAAGLMRRLATRRWLSAPQRTRRRCARPPPPAAPPAGAATPTGCDAVDIAGHSNSQEPEIECRTA